MKERGIIFNTEMVKAILDGRKTVTRRPVKYDECDVYIYGRPTGKKDKVYRLKKNGSKKPFFINDLNMNVYNLKDFCPFGQIGDRLYVRETALYWRTNDGIDKVAAFKADGYCLEDNEQWSPSIHMPKKFARIWLEITDIRVERVQDITEEQAGKEGMKYSMLISSKNRFAATWNSTYKNWNENPWVWVIEFKRIKP